MYQALEILNVAATRKNFKMIQQMTFLDLFSGIGGFRFGMEAAGHKCAGFCEIDKFARMGCGHNPGLKINSGGMPVCFPTKNE